MTHLTKIRDLIDGGHVEQASALIETLNDPEIDTDMLEQVRIVERTLPLLDTKVKRARHSKLTADALWRILGRSTSDRARSILAELDRCVVHDIRDVGLLAPLEADELVLLGCRLSKQGAHPPYATIDASRLDRIRARELALVGFDFEGAKASVGPGVTALSLFACQSVTLGTAPALDHLAYTADKAARHAQLPANLVSAQIDHCTTLTALGGLREQPRLDRVFLRNNPQLADLSPLAHAAETLSKAVLQLSAMTSIAWLGDAKKLSHLDVGGCERLQSIEALRDGSLDFLSLTGCARLRSLDGFPTLTSQPVLDLSGCAAIRDLSPLVDHAASLTCLDLRGCQSLQSLAPLEQLTLRGIALAGTPFTPEAVPAALREQCTWAAKPNLALIAKHA